MTPSLADSSNQVSGARKAAMFVMGIGGSLGAELLRQLDPDEIRRISVEISQLPAVAPDNMLSVFQEFESLSASSRFFAKGGADLARRLVEQAIGAESAQKLLDPPPAATEAQSPAELQILQQTGPQQLAVLLREENPQTVALVLSNLPPEQAGALISLLPMELQPQVAARMATLDRISPEVFRRITEVIGSKLKAVRQVSRSDGIKSLASLLNHVDPTMVDTILSQVEEENQPAASSVREMMFVFDDILTIDKEGMKSLLAKCDRKVLTTALKGTTAKIREHFTQCMSQRAADMMVEDMDALGPVRIRDVQAAQVQVVAVVRQLQQQGAIASNRGGGDEYVV
ncbi:MAG TPA: flagellar motor switch protein FliG [Bryobacteraceae bacterium]|jgi:flagellar motor switch protein FliG|nr:flagellar motor switch protein FliG [Bryobacteraceae bacterium]